MQNILERAAQVLVEDPPLDRPSAGELRLRLRLRRRRRRRGVMVLAVGAVTVLGAGSVLVRARQTSIEPASDDGSSVSVTTAAVTPSLPCDDLGCHGFDPLAITAGDSDFYLGPESFGGPTVDLNTFDALTRCAELSPDYSRCDKLEGLAGISLVSYPAALAGAAADTAAGTIDIGTTFTDISPQSYAAKWGPTSTTAPTSTTTVRGHPAVRYLNEDKPAVVWRERPGVLVWVAVPAGLDDKLDGIANGVRRAPGPQQMSSRVIVPDTGPGWTANDNDADSLVVARLGGSECVAYGSIHSCAQDIASRTYVEQSTGGGFIVTGWTPPAVTSVKISDDAAHSVTAPTAPFAHYAGRHFHVTADNFEPTTVAWLDANGATVAISTRQPNDPSQPLDRPRPWAPPPADITTVVVQPADPTSTTTAEQVPGVTGTDFTTIETTAESAQLAKTAATTLAAAGIVTEPREDATRITTNGTTLQWAYFLETTAPRRLFVTVSPPDQINPDLLDPNDFYTWPTEPGATTISLVTTRHTFTLRSEGIQTTDQPRPAQDLAPLLTAIASSMP